MQPQQIVMVDVLPTFPLQMLNPPPLRTFMMDVDATIPLYVLSPRPYMYVEHSYMHARLGPITTGPKEVLPRHFHYPASGMFLIENKLVSLGGSAWGRRFWVDAFKAADVVLTLTMRIVDGRVLIKMTHTSRSAQTRREIPCTWESTASLFHKGVMIVFLVRRIQRAVLRFLHRRAEPRRLALAMGLHAKLGACSPLFAMPPDWLDSTLLPLLNRVV